MKFVLKFRLILFSTIIIFKTINANLKVYKRSSNKAIIERIEYMRYRNFVCEQLSDTQKTNLCLKMLKMNNENAEIRVKSPFYQATCEPYLYKLSEFHRMLDWHGENIFSPNFYERSVYALICFKHNFEVIQFEKTKSPKYDLLIFPGPPALTEADRSHLTSSSYGIIVEGYNTIERKRFPLYYISGLKLESLN